jgi:hypothetical protein
MAEKYIPEVGFPIHYDQIIEQDGYVTGIAHLSSPSGHGSFEIRVSGQRQNVKDYEQQARIIKLDVARIDSAQQVSDLALQKVLQGRRQEWLGRLELVKIFIESANLDQLSDPEWICKQFQLPDKDSDCKSSEEDLSQDRLIEIRPSDVLDPNLTYLLSFTIHPDVPKGKRDIYRPVVQGSTSASAFISVSSGDADLELYRGGQFRDSSRSAGAFDSVYATGGSGNWKLHVIGYSNATYELSGDWVLQQNNV